MRLYQRKSMKRGGGPAVWWVDYHEGPSRVRRSLHTTSKEVAREIADDLERRAAFDRAGISAAEVPPAPLTRGELLAIYERRRFASGAAEARVRHDVARIERALDWIARRPAEITAARIEEYIVELRRTLSAATIRRDLTPLLAALRQAHREQRIPNDVTGRVTFPRVVKAQIVHLSAAEVTKLLEAAAKGEDPSLHIGVAIAAYTGLRQAEVLHLDWPDVEADRLHVRAKPGWAPKTGEERTVPFGKKLSEVLEPHRRESGPVVRGQRGRRAARWASVAMDELRAKAGVPLAAWHVLRHSYASELVRKGAPIFAVQKLLGHSSVRVTEKFYAALAASELAADVERLGY